MWGTRILCWAALHRANCGSRTNDDELVRRWAWATNNTIQNPLCRIHTLYIGRLETFAHFVSVKYLNGLIKWLPNPDRRGRTPPPIAKRGFGAVCKKGQSRDRPSICFLGLEMPKYIENLLLHVISN